MNAPSPLQKRLSALPAKLAVPFRKLLEAEHISAENLEFILDAGELTGNPPALLGFAVGFLHLRMHNVPVHDVIRMAKSQNRRINLTWSAKRWKAEHDRLARFETLARLSEDNIPYDLSAYDAHLPDTFDGYLIRSSRRLGMEGLRQRHCVASYHSSLQKGKRAIAAIFVDRQRWTVELSLTGIAERPLGIDQIKTRHNAMPSATIRARIYKMLGINGEEPSTSRALQMQERFYINALRRLLPLCREQNIWRITVHFSGSGDDGSIDDIYCSPRENHTLLMAMQTAYLTETASMEDGQWITAQSLTQGSVEEALHALTYDYLEETGVNWTDDHGGFGELIINVEAGTVSLEVSVYVMESHTEFADERDILTGEPV